MGGSDLHNAPGNYASLGAFSTGGVPGERDYSMARTNSNRNFWLFGGEDYYSPFALNDLWEFNAATNEWAWVSDSNSPRASGVYGTQGTPSATNIPGMRKAGATWADKSGYLWLFGGYNGAIADYYNDLWEFNHAAKQWTWISGSSATDALGSYGVLGSPAPANVPEHGLAL
jgi:hypothetical protein